jgi:sulfite reductase alpha subunit-like flavoprotein
MLRSFSLPRRSSGVSICTFVLVKQVNWGQQLVGHASVFLAATQRSSGVSICTFVLVKQVNWGQQLVGHASVFLAATQRSSGVSICTFVLVKHHLTRSSSGVGVCTFVLVKQVNWPDTQLLRRQYMYFCTSKASKLSTCSSTFTAHQRY